jgi:O-antigen/teichoic acid export membrane protein
VSSYKRSLAWNGLATFISQAATLLATVLVARSLGREAFGQVVFIQTIVISLSSIGQLSTGLLASRYVSEYQAVDKAKAGRIIGLCSLATLFAGAILALVVVSIAYIGTDVLFGNASLASGLIFASVQVAFAVGSGYQVGALAGLLAFRAIASSSIICGFLHVILCVGGTQIFGVSGALAGYAISAVFRWIVQNRALQISARENLVLITWRDCLSETHLLKNFAIPAALGTLTTMLTVLVAHSFLAKEDNGLSQLALFGAATTIKSVAMYIPNIISVVATSLFNSAIGGRTGADAKLNFRRHAMHIVGASFLGSLMLCFGGKYLMLLFGKTFSSSEVAILMTVLGVSVLVEAFGLVLFQLIQASGKMWQSFLMISVPRDAVTILLAYYLTMAMGAVGLAVAFLGGHSAALIGKLWLSSIYFRKLR